MFCTGPYYNWFSSFYLSVIKSNVQFFQYNYAFPCSCSSFISELWESFAILIYILNCCFFYLLNLLSHNVLGNNSNPNKVSFEIIYSVV
jgi:hypothetical protein